jgi:hypothetical protein
VVCRWYQAGGRVQALLAIHLGDGSADGPGIDPGLGRDGLQIRKGETPAGAGLSARSTFVQLNGPFKDQADLFIRETSFTHVWPPVVPDKNTLDTYFVINPFVEPRALEAAMKSPVIACLFLFTTLFACTSRWMVLTENPRTKYFVDTKSLVQSGETSWTVLERFLDLSNDRWYLETSVEYDCEARTFMTKTVREFHEQRPVARAFEMSGNSPSVVTPGSDEEARLDAVCEFVGG